MPRARVETGIVHLHLRHRSDDGRDLPVLGWVADRPWRVCATAAVGGGLGDRWWVLNAQVAPGYARHDLDDHLGELAARVGAAAERPGVGLLTAADVDDAVHTVEAAPTPEGAPAGDVVATVTAGVRIPTWAAAPAGGHDPPIDALPPPGTINVVVWLPVAVADGALVNLVATATEAKVQALLELGVPGTGTATDAVVVGCPTGAADAPLDRFGGPRSRWGGPVARAVHLGVAGAARRSLARIEAEATSS